MSERTYPIRATNGEWSITLPEGSAMRDDETSTCPATRAGLGDHRLIRNEDGSAYVCQCGARAFKTKPLPPLLIKYHTPGWKP